MNERHELEKKKHLKLAGAVCKYHLLKEKGPFGESGYRSRYLPHANLGHFQWTFL